MKSKEALNAIHEEAETVSTEPAKLTKEELEQVAGGFDVPNDVYNGDIHIYTNDVKDKEKFTPKFLTEDSRCAGFCTRGKTRL